MARSMAYNPIRSRPASTTSLSATTATISAPSRSVATGLGQFLFNWIYHHAPEGLQDEMAYFKAKSDPYYPVTSSIDHYLANDKGVFELFVTFGGSCALILATTWFALKRWRHNMPLLDKTIVLWFVLTGCLHTIFEGYFVINHGRMASRMDPLGQLWKEYALSDSRYLTVDTFVLSIETVSALVWGPLSLFTAYTVATTNPLRHSLQMIMSLAHIYGCVLYFATATVDSYLKHTDHSRPEFLYFWVYYVGMNLVFIIIPSLVLFQSVSEITSAFAAYDRMRSTIRANGKVPKVEGSVRVSERKKSKE